MKDGLVRADTLPLVFRALGTESLPRGARVRVRITGMRPADAGPACHAAGAASTAPAAAEAALAEPEAEDESRRRRAAAPGHRPGRAGRGRSRAAPAAALSGSAR